MTPVSWEASSKLELMLNPYLWFNGAIDMVDTELAATGGALPRIPPLRGTMGLDFHYGGFSIGPEVVLADSRDDIFSTENAHGRLHRVRPEGFLHDSATALLASSFRGFLQHRRPSLPESPQFHQGSGAEIGRGVRFSYAAKFF